MGFDNIYFYKDGVIGVIKIIGPEAGSRLDAGTLQEINQALDQWEKHEGVNVIVFTGERESRSTAANIRQQRDESDIESFISSLSSICKKIESSNKHTIAAINAFAYGGECELAMACDIRIAGIQAKFRFLPELNQSAGNERAADMILRGEIMSAKEAEEIGLVSKVVPMEELWQTVLDNVSKILESTPMGGEEE